VRTQQVGFNLKADTKFDEKAVLDAMNQEFEGTTVLRKPE
jgi:hypothetical protein